jgi:YD repeat-containing protein
VLRSTFVRYGLNASLAVFACCLVHAQTPTISSISPNPVGIGQSVTISGSNFGTSGSVTFSGVTASTTSWSSSIVVATVPSVAASGNIIVTSGGHSSNGFPFTLNNGPVNYVYDDLGRLVGVIDVKGNAAEYSYDAVGNIVSISRFTSTQVSIIEFTPDSGPIGAAVTINGTGFSATASQDTVKFNGTAATVSSATNRQLTVMVPTGATAGPISVTSPNGTATSSVNFTVTATTNGSPTITSFSPTSGVAGAAVSMTGNFDPTLANDKLRLNVSPATVSSVTSTTLATTVPANTASGHFTVRTPSGNGVSSQDFFVPFNGHVASDIAFTTRMTIGGSQAVTLGANQIALLVFDGVAGQFVSVGETGSTFATCSFYLIGPDNTTVGGPIQCTGASAYLQPTLLKKTGTYTVGIDPGPSGGSLTLAVSSDFLASIMIDGPTVTATTTNGTQDARLTFESLGQRIVVFATNVTNPGANVRIVTLAQPTALATVSINNSPAGQTFFIDTTVLGPPGVYQLWVPNNGNGGGSETLQIKSVPPDLSHTSTVGGAAFQFSTVAGQNANIGFTISSSESVTLHWTNGTYPTTLNCFVSITGPSPSTSRVGFGNCNAATGTVSMGTLSSGTYSILVDPQAQSAGGLSLTLTTP